ncbi:MAG TPA: succinyl-diaminopimelate desuccinylase [Xanthomonadales bacterium]|nr:succinyl-diaminopimelate desuccinylase [Xanthomonadales bacterium]
MNKATKSRVNELCRELVSRPSITPDDAGCQSLIFKRLMPLGFEAKWFYCGDVTNVLITFGNSRPSLWFLGHTDVVPTGPVDLWTHPPFSPTESEGLLYGRGVADMKGAVAAMVIAFETWVQQNPEQERGQLGLLLTSDEEGDAINGIVRVAKELKLSGNSPDYCLVGEPSSLESLGDSVRIGRRGSIHVNIRVAGIQGHTAFPQFLDNPVHSLAPFLAEWVAHTWDEGNADFPPTSAQVAFLNAGTGARNVTPADVELQLNIRHCPETTSSTVKSVLEDMLKRHGVENYELKWQVSGEPFYSEAGALRAATLAACKNVLGVEPDLNTGGGTSDGRFIAPLGTEVLELGLINSSIHKIDECTPTADLDRLAAAYYDIIRQIFTLPPTV